MIALESSPSQCSRSVAERRVDLLGRRERRDQRAWRGCLLMTPGFSHFSSLRVLDVAEHEHERLLFAGRELDLQAVRRDRRPAAGHRVLRLARRDGVRLVEAVVQAEKRLAIGVEAGDRARSRG